MDRRVLVRALEILQDKGKATIFGLDGEEEDEVGLSTCVSCPYIWNPRCARTFNLPRLV